MQPKSPGYPRAAKPKRSGLTRRAVLGAAAVLGGAGLAEVLHKPGHGAAAPPSAARSRATAAETHARLSEASPVIPTPTSTHSASHAPVATHTHQATHHGGDRPVGHHPGAHGRSHAERRAAKVEHVTLPPPKVRVRKSPVYTVDELISNAPKRAIALTIDDGPDPDWTPKVLRLLDKHHMQASFCVVGVHAEAYPRLVRDVAKAGHVIVNHSFSHIQPFNHQTEKRIVAEITRTQRAIEKAAKVTPQLFRAPGGAWSPFIFRAAAAYGLIPLDWDVDPADWERPGTRRIERAMLRGRPGDIVLCHDGGGNRSETVRALRKVLPTWKRRGYTTIPLIVPASAMKPPPSPSTPPQSPSPTVTPTGSASTSPTP